jgi:hypothetical protein
MVLLLLLLLLLLYFFKICYLVGEYQLKGIYENLKKTQTLYIAC